MSKCFCLRLFNYLDVFRFPLTFTLNKQEKATTLIGKFMTIGIIIFLLYSFNQSDVLNKQNPLTFSQDSILQFRPPMWFLKENFTFVFGVADANNIFLNDPTIFTITFYMSSINNTNHQTNLTQMALIPCTREDFIEDPKEFDKLGLQGAYCLPISEMKLSGYWNEPEIDYLDFQLTICQNSSDSSIICQPQEIITDILSNYYVDIYITDHNIDVSNYLSPFSRNLQIYYKQVDINILKTMNFYLRNSILDTDDGFFFESRNFQKKVSIEKVDFDVDSRDLSNPLLFDCSIYVSNLEKIIIRKYQKIQTLLAQLGGICNFLFFLGFFISKIENNYRLISLFGNELFIFPKILAKTQKKLPSKMEPLDALIEKNLRESQNTKRNSKIINKKEGKRNSKILNKKEGIQPILSARNFETERKSILKENDIKLMTETYLSPKILSGSDPNVSFHESEEESSNSIKKSVFFNGSETGIKDSIKTAKNSVSQGQSPRKRKNVKEKLKNSWLFSLKSKREIFEKKEKNLEIYQKMRNRENFFSIGIWGYLKLILKSFRFFLTTKEKLFLRSQQQIADQLDILLIMKQVQEIDKLKRILLNDEELYLFNLVSKPMVLLDNKTSYLSKEDKDKRFKFSLFEKPNLEKDSLQKNYEKVTKYAENSEIDKRLLKLIDEDVICFLKNEICTD